MFYYGVDYYPEHWPRERWPEDARLMAEAGLNVARLAEFAWALLEPEPGRYDFSWLDEAIATLYARGIRVILCTPTAVPPNWMVRRDPTILPVDKGGLRSHPGGRRHYCVNHPGYREESRRIARAMAEHYRDHPAVIGWQIDNEFGCHDTTRCYCAHCDAAFRRWLQQRYGSPDELNQRWGTVFWSLTFQNWEQVTTPRVTAAQHHPSLLLDFYRFASDANVAYQRLQVEVLREVNPRWFVTHNLMGLFNQIDYFRLAEDLNFVSWDNYFAPHPPLAAVTHDLMRGLKPGRSFWVMEQQCGQVNWKAINELARPGQVRLWAWQDAAHGADGVVYFRWRACRFGPELYHSGLLNHGAEITRSYEEAARVGRELQQVADLAGSRIENQVAILYDYDQNWAVELQRHHRDFDYSRQVVEWHQAFARRGIPVDVLHPHSGLGRYRLVVAPALQLVDDGLAAHLGAYVEQGGVLVAGVRLGCRDPYNVCFAEQPPGPLAGLFGVRVAEFDALPAPGQPVLANLPHPVDRALAVRFLDQEYPAALWADILRPEGAEVLGTFTRQFYAGAPAVTRHRVGRGQAVYAGAAGAELLAAVAAWAADQAGVTPLVRELSPGIDVQQRISAGGRRTLFLLNPHESPGWATLPGPGTDRLTGQRVEPNLDLPPFAVRIISPELPVQS